MESLGADGEFTGQVDDCLMEGMGHSGQPLHSVM
jgi:hypothetical protein